MTTHTIDPIKVVLNETQHRIINAITAIQPHIDLTDYQAHILSDFLCSKLGDLAEEYSV